MPDTCKECGAVFDDGEARVTRFARCEDKDICPYGKKPESRIVPDAERMAAELREYEIAAARAIPGLGGKNAERRAVAMGLMICKRLEEIKAKL